MLRRCSLSHITGAFLCECPGTAWDNPAIARRGAPKQWALAVRLLPVFRLLGALLCAAVVFSLAVRLHPALRRIGAFLRAVPAPTRYPGAPLHAAPVFIPALRQGSPARFTIPPLLPVHTLYKELSSMLDRASVARRGAGEVDWSSPA